MRENKLKQAETSQNMTSRTGPRSTTVFASILHYLEKGWLNPDRRWPIQPRINVR
jgi:hypothetical protein